MMHIDSRPVAGWSADCSTARRASVRDASAAGGLEGESDMRAVMPSIALAVCLASPMAASSAFAKDAKTAPPSDKTLDSRIEYRIHHDAVLKKYKIDVAVEKGVATLSGAVPTDA